ncbi:TlpA disulfide reductase family protein [Gaiella sp.]|uniref:TlpA family protein disulfide reductase n=1 Tax=Gaiella sp. TaxID=2663207 RepID=UPI002CE85288|nr:TlpA disulfide reductase family protein [Gaiella sp.]HWO80094.1 TlpA disulfide reductase family protein [Gaiella sp.]
MTGGGQGSLQRVAQVIALVGVAALLGLLIWRVAFKDNTGAADELAAGKLVDAPAFTLDRLDRSGQLALDDLKGKAVVVNFWASWCIPCRDEAPVLQKTYERYRDRGLVVLGVDVNDFKADARRFMKRYGITYPVAYDGKGSTVGKWGVRGFPETFFVDRTGTLVGERIEGAVDIERNRETFERGIALALADAP